MSVDFDCTTFSLHWCQSMKGKATLGIWRSSVRPRCQLTWRPHTYNLKNNQTERSHWWERFFADVCSASCRPKPRHSCNSNGLKFTLAMAHIPTHQWNVWTICRRPVKALVLSHQYVSLGRVCIRLYSTLLCNLFPGSIINPLAICYSDLKMHILHCLLHALQSLSV